MKQKYTRQILIWLLVVLFSGCASNHKKEPKPFGASVRNMIKAQIYDRSTIKNPPMDVVKGMDSTKAISDLRRIYRKSVANKQQVKRARASASE